MGTSYFYQILTGVVKSNRHGWKWQKYEKGVIKRVAKRTEDNLGCRSLGCVRKEVLQKYLGMQETRKIFWQDLVRSEDRCYLALAVFFIRRNDFPVSGSVQQFLQLQLLSKFYCSECFNPIDNDLLASLI